MPSHSLNIFGLIIEVMDLYIETHEYVIMRSVDKSDAKPDMYSCQEDKEI